MTKKPDKPKYPKLTDPTFKQAAESFGNRIYIDPELMNRFKALSDDKLKLSISTLDKLREVFNISKINLFLAEEKRNFSFTGVRPQGNTLTASNVISESTTKTSSRKNNYGSKFHYSDSIEVNVYIDPNKLINLFNTSYGIDYQAINDPKQFAIFFNKLALSGIKIEGLKFNTVDFFNDEYFFEGFCGVIFYWLILMGFFALIIDNNPNMALWQFAGSYLIARVTKTIYLKSEAHNLRPDNTYISPFGPSPEILVKSILLMLEDLKIIYFKES